MALNCEACSDLRDYAPDFVLNGVTDDICASLENNTGLNPSLDPVHEDCEDLHDVNDCLVGNMEAEVDAYEVCDWKTYIKKIIPNIHQTIKAIICSICGIWKNIKRIYCLIDDLYNDKEYAFGESTSGDAYCVAGKGVSFLIPHEGKPHTSDINMSIFSNNVIGGGSLHFRTTNFTDVYSCGNFDNGSDYRVSQSRKGNSEWGLSNHEFLFGGELLYELRIKNELIDNIDLYPLTGYATGRNFYQCYMAKFVSGSYAYGQHGGCEADGSPHTPECDSGHLVPTGWTYIQVRLRYCFNSMGDSNGKQLSPKWFGFAKRYKDRVDCD